MANRMSPRVLLEVECRSCGRKSRVEVEKSDDPLVISLNYGRAQHAIEQLHELDGVTCSTGIRNLLFTELELKGGTHD